MFQISGKRTAHSRNNSFLEKNASLHYKNSKILIKKQNCKLRKNVRERFQSTEVLQRTNKYQNCTLRKYRELLHYFGVV